MYSAAKSGRVNENGGEKKEYREKRCPISKESRIADQADLKGGEGARKRRKLVTRRAMINDNGGHDLTISRNFNPNENIPASARARTAPARNDRFGSQRRLAESVSMKIIARENLTYSKRKNRCARCISTLSPPLSPSLSLSPRGVKY